MNCPCCDYDESGRGLPIGGVSYLCCTFCASVFAPRLPPGVCKTNNESPGERNSIENMQTRVSRISERVPGARSIVDFGCGNMEFVRHLEESIPDAHIVGIDTYTHATLRSIPAGFVDAVVAVEVLEHLFTPRYYMCEFGRVLRPGGIVYAETCPTDAIDPETHPYVDPCIGHVTIYSEKALALLAEMAGMNLEDKINPTTFVFRKKGSP